jgi:hypothetical protein
MAHYAFLNKQNVVVEVIAGVDENELIEGLDPETWYGNFRKKTCKRTSYNSRIRGTYAGVGYSYDETEDIFITPKPFNSWIRVGSFWKAPIDRPDDGQMYVWNEENQSWDLLNE